ncbi:MAG: RQC domain-containing protein, partial [Acidobacteriota bacterium]
GETAGRDSCGMCDNCLADSRETIDLTIPAQKFLSCVKRSGEQFGIGHIIDILRGSKSGKVLKNRHDRLSTYGIGMDYSKTQWQRIASLLLHRGFMVQDPVYGGLSLTQAAWDVFMGTIQVLGNPGTGEPPAKPESGSTEGFERDEELFDLLRQRRRELAQKANVPPYVIFSDKTLTEMAIHFPQTPERFLEIHGIGRGKLANFGSIFIDLIKDYCRERGIEERPSPSREPSPPKQNGDRITRGTAVVQAFNEGQSIRSLMEKYEVSRDTILNHLFLYARDGQPLRPQGLLPLIEVPARELERAMKAFERLGSERLKPVYEALDGEISYEDLKAIRLYRLSLINQPSPAEVPPVRKEMPRIT